MSCGMRILVLVAIVMTLLAPDTVAQKPPAPTPSPAPPTPTQPGRAGIPSNPGMDPTQPQDDLVMFLRGRIATNDGSAIPSNLMIERVCNNRTRQEVYASQHGDFSMQLGSRADSFPEGSADSAPPYNNSARRDLDMGIPRRDLKNCELRASAPDFHPSVRSLIDLEPSDRNVDVGVIVVKRARKVEGNTVSAVPYKLPKDARKAYEKGVQAERNGKLADAQKNLETAVKIYPNSANAWYQLGTVLQKEERKDEARKAYTQATTIDSKFLPPFQSLASMAYQAENWTEVLELTNHILDLDPLNHAAVNSYILDLDPVNYAGAYFYNAMANYQLKKLEDAERSALKAEHLDMRTHFPQLHLLVAEIFARKNDYGVAIAEIQTYLALVPHAPDADQVRERLAKLEELNGSASATGKPDHR
jgi:tetratricopeptide (TPR) repeat protein